MRFLQRMSSAEGLMVRWLARGDVHGGGSELAAACDRRTHQPKAKLTILDCCGTEPRRWYISPI